MGHCQFPFVMLTQPSTTTAAETHKEQSNNLHSQQLLSESSSGIFLFVVSKAPAVLGACKDHRQRKDEGETTGLINDQFTTIVLPLIMCY